MRAGETTMEARYRLTDKALEVLDVGDDPVVYAPSPFGPFPGELVKPRCYRCRRLLADCGCSGATS